jgi:pSer/pThr/pTyr-binding forkhead associated (FHA) protein
VEVILEIIHANGARTLHRVGAQPLTLGRGFSNDIIVDDPYIDARHARLTRDADFGLMLEDLGTVNGFVANAIRQHGSIALHAGDAVRVGRTTLRVHDPNEAVVPALPDKVMATPASGATAPWGHVRHEPTPRPRWLGTNRRSAFIVAAATIAVALNIWLSTADGSGLSDVFSLTLGLVLIAAAWAAIWAVVGRAVVHRFDFAGHFAIVSLVFIAALAVVVVQEWMNFLFPDSGAVTAFVAVTNLALLTTLISLHLSLVSSVPRRRRWQGSLVSAVAAFAIGAVFAMADDNQFSDVPVFSSVIKPVTPSWVPTSTVEEFAKVPQALKLQVDAMAAK